MSGCSTMRRAHLLADAVHEVAPPPAGGPPRAASRPRASTVCGTSSAGLKTTAFPHSSAGNIFQVGIASGKLNGVMSPPTPIGPAVAHRPLAAQLATARCGRRAGGPRWPRSRRCRSLPARRRGSRRAPCPSRASRRARSRPCARPAGRPRALEHVAARRRRRAAPAREAALRGGARRGPRLRAPERGQVADQVARVARGCGSRSIRR